ncbi:MAG TPA: efflux RND transporter periplasmic adaptor subunit [Planctomycetaceae bacterium]|nr:efflux RND transporter periplasmic adaptor subunit [Planctomycetaceae bacterium]
MQRVLLAAVWSAFICPAVIGLSGCSTGAAKPSGPGTTSAPPEVTVVRPVEKPVTDFEEFTGRSDAVDTVDIRARVTGFLEQTKFVDGDEVEQNALLYVIDHRPYDADKAAAEASLDSALAQQLLKTSDFDRVRQLRDKGQVSLEEFDRARAQRDEADASVERSRAELDKAKLNVDFCYVTAPLAGRISRAKISNGNLINADSTVLTTIVSVENMYIYFDVDERAMLKFQQMMREQGKVGYRRERLPVRMALVLDEGFPHRGFVDFVENRLDANTGTIRVRAQFQNPKPSNGGPRLLSPGLFARVRIPISDQYPALFIPDRAVGTDQGQKFVYVVDGENKAEYRRISVGPLRGGWRVAREGIGANDRVIVSGLQRVRPKMIVSPKDEEPSDGPPDDDLDFTLPDGISDTPLDAAPGNGKPADDAKPARSENSAKPQKE